MKDLLVETFWNIRRHPATYLPYKSIWTLRDFLAGYSNRLSFEGFDSGLAGLYGPFQEFLDQRFQLRSGSRSVYQIVEFCSRGPEQAFYRFYDLFEEFLENTKIEMRPFTSNDRQKKEYDLFTIVSSIRKRPELYVVQPSFVGVYTYLRGQEKAGGDMGRTRTNSELFFEEFKKWVEREMMDDGRQRGWFKQIQFSSYCDCGTSPGTAYTRFFELLDEFAKKQGKRTVLLPVDNSEEGPHAAGSELNIG